MSGEADIFSDADVTAFLDGEADEVLDQRLRSALRHDADLARRVETLVKPLHVVREAFDLDAAAGILDYVSLLDDFSFPRLRATTVLRIPFVSWRIAIMVAFTFMSMYSAAYLYVHIRKGLGLPLKSDTAKEALQ